VQVGQPVGALADPGHLIDQAVADQVAPVQLATDLPAAVLARLLGIHISVAVAWQRASAGDWATYAAQISRRARQPGST
jgi:hypothetical protein